MLFSILGTRLQGAWVLDLFAGSGILGIEALSRGARALVAVEQDPSVAALIRSSLHTCRIAHQALLVEESVMRPGLDQLLIQRMQAQFGCLAPFDLVFMDPPYHLGLVAATLERLAASTLIAPGGVAVAEHEAGSLPKGVAPTWHPMHNRRQGDSQVSFWQWSG